MFVASSPRRPPLPPGNMLMFHDKGARPEETIIAYLSWPRTISTVLRSTLGIMLRISVPKVYWHNMPRGLYALWWILLPCALVRSSFLVGELGCFLRLSLSLFRPPGEFRSRRSLLPRPPPALGLRAGATYGSTPRIKVGRPWVRPSKVCLPAA